MASETGRAAYRPSLDEFDYEVQYTEEEWRSRLTDFEYTILREGGTEPQRTSAYWDETSAGAYHCKGCDLKIYDSRWKTVLDKGWLFFKHAEPNTLMMGIDWPEGADKEDRSLDVLTSVETHCRRCGSHMGHYFIVDGKLLQCINGTSLTFVSADA